MQHTALQGLPLGAGHGGYVRPYRGSCAGAQAVFQRTRGALLHPLYYPLLHGLCRGAQGILVVGKAVGVLHPHAGQLHQAAHLRVPQLCFQGEARHVPAQQGFLRRPLGVQLLHKPTARCGQTGRQACFRQERLPDAWVLNVGVTKGFTLFGVRVFASLSVDNLLDRRDIVYGGYEQMRFDEYTAADGRNAYRPFPARYSYAYPRTFLASLTVSF